MVLVDAKSLNEEFDAVTAELAEARTEYARLGARIAGLEAQRSALARALPQGPETSGENEVGSQHRTDDIVEVLLAKGSPMSIKEVVAALRDGQRPNENYDYVSVDLAYLAGRDRVQRVSRGVYAARPAVRVDGDSRRVIQLTQGNIRNGHVYLSRCVDFFPDDVFGGASRDAGVGQQVELTFDGSPDRIVKTDIASDKKIFRGRAEWREFFAQHSLRPGDSVVLNRQSKYRYHVSADRQSALK
jgi:hypothetical protein